MRTGTLALFRDFHGDNRPARDPHGRNVEENGRERKNDGDGDGPGSSGRGSGGMHDELIPLAEWEIDLGNPAFPRADCSTFLTEQSA